MSVTSGHCRPGAHRSQVDWPVLGAEEEGPTWCFAWRHVLGPGRAPCRRVLGQAAQCCLHTWVSRQPEGPARLTRVSLGTAELVSRHRLKQKGASLPNALRLQEGP